MSTCVVLYVCLFIASYFPLTPYIQTHKYTHISNLHTSKWYPIIVLSTTCSIYCKGPFILTCVLLCLCLFIVSYVSVTQLLTNTETHRYLICRLQNSILKMVLGNRYVISFLFGSLPSNLNIKSLSSNYYNRSSCPFIMTKRN